MRPYLLEKLKRITPEEQAILDGNRDLDSTLYNMDCSMVVDAKALLETGASIELRPHTRFLHFPEHKHNYVEVIYMCSGSTKHMINKQELILQEGELLFLSQNTTQEVFPAGYNDVAVNFIILPTFFDKALSMMGVEKSLLRNFVIECLRNDSQDISYLHFKVADILPIQNLMENLIGMLINKHTSTLSLNQTTMGLLFLHLMGTTSTVDIGGNQYENTVLLQVYRNIEEGYREGSLTAIAKEMKCDLYWLSRFIKKTTGKTFKTMLQEKRLEQAAFLLKHTNLSVVNTSLDVGYSNFSYFHRIFKSYYGLTPADYRAKFGPKQE